MQYNWKGNDFDTVIIVAPIDIDNKPYMMGVIVKKAEETDRLYLHEVSIANEEGQSAQFKTWSRKKRTGNANYPSLMSILRDVQKSNRKGEKGKNTTGGAKEKYSINPKFEVEYDTWDKKDPRKKFKVGRTSEALRSIGIEDQTIEWDASKILKIKKKHPAMTDEIIKQVPQILEKPIIVMQSRQDTDRLTVFGEVTDANGDHVLAVLELKPTDRKGMLLNRIKIASAYGKQGNIQNFIDNSKIEYIEPDKKRTDMWLKRTGLQLPVGISKYGSINTIPQTEGKDNQKSEKEQKTNEKAKEKHSLANQNPKRSRKVLRDALMREFSVGAGQKRGAMEIIDRAAAEIVKKGKLSTEGAEELFAGLVGRGVITERGDEYNRAVYDTLHSAKLRVTKNMISDIERIYGSVKNLRSKALGKIALTNDPNAAAENIDTYYEGLQQDFGRGMFPDAMHPADMMANILDAYERTAPKKKSLLDNIAEEAGDAGAFREMMNGFRETLDRALEQFGASAAIEMDTEQTYEKQMQAFREKRREQAARAKHAREFREEQNRLLSIAKQLKKLRPGQAGYDDVPEIVRQIDTVAKGISANGRIRLEGLSEQMQEFSELDENTVFSTHLMRQMDRLNNMHIAEMSEEDVRDLLDVCIEARHRIETQNKLIREKETQELHEAAGRALSAIGRAKDTWRRNRNGGSGGKRSMARAKNVFLEISNYEDDNPLMQSFYDLENGQTKMIDYEYRAEKAVMDKLEEIFPSKRAMEKFPEETAGRNAAWADVDTGGQTLRLTAGMKMAIYLHSKNRANMRHISGYVTEGEGGRLYQKRGGGVVIPNERLYKKGNMKEAYLQGDTVHLTAGEVKRIAASLTAEQRAYADAMYDFLNGESKELINGVSRKLNGRDVAVVERYWPMTVATDKIESKTLDGMTRDLSVTSAGSLKERQEGSTAPLLLFDAPTAFERNTAQSSKYVGYALPIENFRKLYNAGDGGTRVKEAIARKFGGSVATDEKSYIEEFIKDISKPADKTTFLDRQRGKAAAATMTLNPKVVAKQVSALFTAMDTLGAGNVLQALSPKRKASMKLINKYTRLLWNRAKGYSSTAMEDVQNAASGKMRWLKQATDYINKTDAALCRRMWVASEIYTEKNRPDLTPGTDEFYMAVAETFNRMIYDTQGGATMMQKSRNARSGNALVKGMNMFRSDAEAALNMMGESIGRRNAAAREYKEAKKAARAAGVTEKVSASSAAAMKKYGIESIDERPQDVSRKIIAKLREENFLSTEDSPKPIENLATGRQIEIWQSGIRETIHISMGWMRSAVTSRSP